MACGGHEQAWREGGTRDEVRTAFLAEVHKPHETPTSTPQCDSPKGS